MKTTAESPSHESFNNSYIGVYCRRKTPNAETRMKRRYLSVIGRQSQVDCHKHNCPLILNQFPKCTNENSSYRCICRNAEKTVMRADTIAGATAHISAHSITKIVGLPFVMSM